MDIHELSLDWFRNHLVESPVRHNAAENGLNSVKTNLASQSMRHHLYFSRLSRPENGRKTSLVYDVEVCIVLHQDFRCMSLGCSRLLRSWRTPHQCFLHQLYNICVLQLWSKHWTSAHKESRYFYMLRQGPQQWKKLYNCNSFDPLSSKYLAIANARWIFWTLAYRVQFFFLAAKKIGLCKPVSKWFTSHPSFKRNSYLGVRENSRVFQWKDICFLWQIQYHSWMASKYDSWNCPVNF